MGHGYLLPINWTQRISLWQPFHLLSLPFPPRPRPYMHTDHHNNNTSGFLTRASPRLIHDIFSATLIRTALRCAALVTSCSAEPSSS